MSNSTKKRIIPIAALGAAVLAVPLAGVALAGAVAANAAEAPVGSVAVEPGGTGDDLAARELAEDNEVEREFAAFLAERGIAYTVVVEDDGRELVELTSPDATGQAAWDEFWGAQVALTTAGVEQSNAGIATMVEKLAEQGHVVATRTTVDGLLVLEREQAPGVDDALDDYAKEHLDLDFLMSQAG